MNRKEQYAIYLKTAVWFSLAKDAKKRDGEKCVLCNSPKNLHVHHREYPEVLGTEPIEYLTTLCKNCHKQFHKVDNKRKKRKKNKLEKKKYKKKFFHKIVGGCRLFEEPGRQDCVGCTMDCFIWKRTNDVQSINIHETRQTKIKTRRGPQGASPMAV